MKVNVAFPIVGDPKLPFMMSFIAMSAHESKKGDGRLLGSLLHSSGCYIHKNRNNLVEQYLASCDPGQEWHLQLDTDISFPPTLLEELLKWADPTERAVVCGAYPIQGMGPSLYRKVAPGWYQNLTWIDVNKVQCVEIDGAGTGCMLIHRSVLEKMAELHASSNDKWFFHDADGENNVGEDLSFCERARNAGFKLFGVTGLGLQHWKLQPVVTLQHPVLKIPDKPKGENSNEIFS